MDEQTGGAAEASAAIAEAEAHNEPKVGTKDKLEELCVNTIRFLAIDGVGMGIASKMMAARFNSDGAFKPVQNWIYVICSDGDLEEGISSEAASLAGHLGLGNLIYLYDDNDVTLDGDKRLSMSEDVKKRFEAAHWHVQKIDGHDRDAVRKAIRKAQKVTDKPSMIMAKTVIGWGSPKYHGTSRAHGEPLGPE